MSERIEKDKEKDTYGSTIGLAEEAKNTEIDRIIGRQ
jgi:hypothetical protein